MPKSPSSSYHRPVFDSEPDHFSNSRQLQHDLEHRRRPDDHRRGRHVRRADGPNRPFGGRDHGRRGSRLVLLLRTAGRARTGIWRDRRRHCARRGLGLATASAAHAFEGSSFIVSLGMWYVGLGIGQSCSAKRCSRFFPIRMPPCGPHPPRLAFLTAFSLRSASWPRVPG